ncbi:MAG: PD40 domain-containing protein [Mariniphaga sp.]|nr:PD40 domain-containing protein [Mariniphaga sp.]
MRQILVFLVCFTLVTSITFGQEKQADELLNNAIYQEEVKGNLEGAILIYMDIIKKYPEQRAIAVEALFHLGLSNEKLGNNKAKEYYETIVNSFGDQPEFVRIAQERLSSLERFAEKISNAPLVPKFTKINIPTNLPQSVALSPDGKNLVLVRDKKLWKILLSGNLGPGFPGIPEQLNTDGVEVLDWVPLSWSQNGKWIAFNGNPPLDEEGNENVSIYVVSSDGGKPKKVIENDRDVEAMHYRISLSPNGNNLAFSSYNNQHIFSTPLDKVIPRQLVEMEACEPVFSPDGKYIAFVKDNNEGIGAGNLGLWVVEANGGKPYKLADAGDASSPIWSPDGKLIAFHDYSLFNQISIVPFSKTANTIGKVIRIEAPGSVRGLTGWTHDNKIGALTIKDTKYGLYTLPVEGGQAAKILQDTMALQPRWSKNCEQIYYVTYPEEGTTNGRGYILASVSASGGNGKPLKTNYKGKLIKQLGFISGNKVSPDGKWIVTSTWTQADANTTQADTNTINVDWPTSKIWKVSVDGEDAIQITNTPGNFFDSSLCWSADGKKIAFVHTELNEKSFFGDSRIYIIDSNGGEPELLDPNPGIFATHLIWSPDGKKIAYTDGKEFMDPKILKIIDIESRDIRVFEEFPEINMNTELVWSPDSKRIAFNAADGKVIKIMNIDDGSIEDIKTGLLDVRTKHLDWSPDGKRFVFGGRTIRVNELWLMEDFLPLDKLAQKKEKNDNKFKISQISPNKKIDFLGAFGFLGSPSPDGKYLSFTDAETGNLTTYEIATGEKQSLTNEGSINPASAKFAYFSRWSPDSKEIVYDWFNKGIIELRIIGLDGSKPRILYSNEEVIWAQTCDWSADGTKILAAFQRKDEIQIVLISTANGSVRILKTLEKEWPKKFEFSMNLSPDGRYIVYDFPQKTGSPERDIFMLSTDGEPEITLCENPADDHLLGWAPNGKTILFVSDRRGSIDAWSIQLLDGKPQGNPEIVKSDIGQRFQPIGFTQEGSFYYGKEGGRNNDIYIAKLDPETGKIIAPPKSPVTRYKGNNWIANYSPDGKYLAYVSGKGNLPRNLLIIHSLETGEEKVLSTNIHKIQKHIWSPDCSSILFRGEDENYNAGIYQIDIQTGIVTTVVPKSSNTVLQVMQWSGDGKSFYMGRTSNSNKIHQIVIRDLESGTEKELYRVSPNDLLFYPININHIIHSPDGKWLSFTIRKEKELKIMPVAGGEPRVLYKCEQEDDNIDGFRWSPDGKYIFWVLEQPKQNKCSIWRIPIEGGETQKILEMNNIPTQSIRKLSIHPNGQQIAFQSVSPFEDSEVWVMENFLPKEETVNKQE